MSAEKKQTLCIVNGRDVTLELKIASDRLWERETLTVVHHRDGWQEAATHRVFRSLNRAMTTSETEPQAMSCRGFGFLILPEEGKTKVVIHADSFRGGNPLDLDLTMAPDETGVLRGSGTLEVTGKTERFTPTDTPVHIVHLEDA